MNIKPFRYSFVTLLNVMGNASLVVFILLFLYLVGHAIVTVSSSATSDPVILNAKILHIQSPDVVVVETQEGVLHVLLDDILAPRLTGDCSVERDKARAAMAWLRATIIPPSPDQPALTIKIKKSFNGRLRLAGGYLVATPQLADGRDLAEAMIAAGHAVRASNDGRKIWWGC